MYIAFDVLVFEILITIRHGLFRKENMHDWVKTCLRKTKDMFNDPVVLVIYNATIHSRLEEIVQEPEFMGNHILRLGPCSPMLNPMESVWSAFKAEVKHLLTEKMMDMLRGVSQGNLPSTKFHLKIL